ncbi:MAG: hypothetical protein KF705_06020 [Phycisphaeraceae bacterium]|nr:hypothetical protein [Phycisphaeraceae bacterium]
MSDTPSQGEPISLDSVIDELLESAAQDQSATTEEHAETTATPATEEGLADPHAHDLAAATHHSEQIQDPRNESLAKSPDVPLKEVSPAATVSGGRPELPTDLAATGTPGTPEPSIQNYAGPAPAGPIEEAEDGVTPTDSGTEPPEALATAEPADSDAGTIQSLDAELAALTDDLLAGDFEAPAPPEPEQAPETPQVQEPGAPHPAAHAAPVVGATAAVTGPAREPTSQSPMQPSASEQPVASAGVALSSRAIAPFRCARSGASEPARIALGLSPPASPGSVRCSNRSGGLRRTRSSRSAGCGSI